MSCRRRLLELNGNEIITQSTKGLPKNRTFFQPVPDPSNPAEPSKPNSSDPSPPASQPVFTSGALVMLDPPF
jgi:hypothetical protein